MPRQPSPPRHDLDLAPEDRDAIWRLLRGLGCDHATADELTQETLLRAVQEARRRGPEFMARRAWLFTVARHLFVDRWRQRGRAIDISWTSAVEAELSDCLAVDASAEWQQAARDCVHELAPRAAEIVQLFYAEDRSRSDIAHQLGMTEAGVKTALQRARQVLERCLRTRMPCPNPQPNSSTPSCEPC